MNWLSIYPEIALLIMACVVTLIDLFVRDPMHRPTYVVTQLSLAVVAAMHFADFSAGLTVYAMDRMVVSDPLGHLLGFFACVVVIAVLVYARANAAQREMLNGEFFSL
ncbi:MAG TPA: NADH:ubiquinone oxidoreductase subunit N, partial [Burkholderiaceae bacterium]|nr:NADH:ubiquinone oxidoreductase subunit N [Burkholderiaceae bacterium]